VSVTSSAGVHMGQTATEKGAPSAKAPHSPSTRRARTPRQGMRGRSQPAQTRPISTSTGPRTTPHQRPIRAFTDSPAQAAPTPSAAWVASMPATKATAMSRARRPSWARVT